MEVGGGEAENGRGREEVRGDEEEEVGGGGSGGKGGVDGRWEGVQGERVGEGGRRWRRSWVGGGRREEQQ